MARELHKGVFMTKNDEALAKALFTLREVTQTLARGVKKADFKKHYRGKYVSPGISVRRHVEELSLSGSLDETETTIKLRPRHAHVAAC